MVSREGNSPADILAAVAAEGGTAPRVVHRINDYTTVAALVGTGNVLGILPRYTAAVSADAGVVLRPLEGINNRRRIDMLARPETLRRRSVRLVADALGAAMRELAGTDG